MNTKKKLQHLFLQIQQYKNIDFILLYYLKANSSKKIKITDFFINLKREMSSQSSVVMTGYFIPRRGHGITPCHLQMAFHPKKNA
jgi:hypothetical protein